MAKVDTGTKVVASVASPKSGDVTRRITNVKGQLDGILRMMDEGNDCVAVLTQFKAARAGFDRAFALFLEENLKKCVGVSKMSDAKQAEVESILAALAK